MKNSVEISGKFKKVNLKYLGDGKAVANGSLATMYKKKGATEPIFSYFNLEAWAELAENMAEAETSDEVFDVKGYLKQSSWKSPEGKNFSKTVIVVTEFAKAEFKASGDKFSKKPNWDGSKSETKKTYSKPQASAPTKQEEDKEDEVPF